MAKNKCPFGLSIGKDFGTDNDCEKCFFGFYRDNQYCKALREVGAVDRLTGPALIHFARIALNMSFDTFVRVVYGGSADSPSRKKYLDGKFKIWTDNPMKLICQLDYAHLATLAAHIQYKLDTEKD